MARQKSLIKIEGTIGDLTFYKSKNGGYLAREKGGISADRIKKDPAFQRTRENLAEFGRAGKACKLFRSAFRDLIQKGADSTMTSRLMKLFMEVIHADNINMRGKRMVLDAETELLRGFEFNSQSPIESSIFIPYRGEIDRQLGILKIHFPEFTPDVHIAAPAGATHFVLSATGAMINFETGKSESVVTASAPMELSTSRIPESTLECLLNPDQVKPLFLCLGVEYYQRVNNEDYLLSNGAFNGVSIITVSGL